MKMTEAKIVFKGDPAKITLDATVLGHGEVPTMGITEHEIKPLFMADIMINATGDIIRNVVFKSKEDFERQLKNGNLDSFIIEREL